MPAPSNDNFANAALITGTSGNTTGTNISATAEAGEPGNFGKTVWYKWVCATSQAITFFTTFDPAAAAVTAPRLKTILQIFTGASVGALTEMLYFGKVWKTNYANWEVGSQVAISAVAGSTYYIRVDGVASKEGNFSLSWQPTAYLNIGGCGNCPPNFSGGICKGVISYPQTFAGFSKSFGTFPAGAYMVRYCGGADLGGDGFWHINEGPDAGLPGNDDTSDADWFRVRYNGTTTGSATGFADLQANKINYATLAAAELDNYCLNTFFAHTGGDIHMVFLGGFDADEIITTPAYGPIFGLYLVPPLILKKACASWVSIGVSGTCDFTITNRGPALTGVTATLNSSGGITSPSSPQVVNLPNGDTVLTFTFDAATTNVTAQLAITGSGAGLPVTFTTFLAPIIVITLSSGPNNNMGCADITTMIFGIKNFGFWAVNPSYECTISDGSLHFVPSLADCTNLGNPHTYVALGTIPCAGVSGGVVRPQWVAPAASEPGSLTIHAFDASGDYGTFIFPITLAP